MIDRIKILSNLLKKEPDDAFLNYALALEHQKKGDIPKAIELLKKIISATPDYLGSYYQLGKIFEEANKIDEAIAFYKEGIIVAKKQGNQKTLGELSEALMIISDDYES